jgi:hypothetical protein
MAWELSFERLHQYNAGEPGINLPLTLRSGTMRVNLTAKLDTGSSDCIFERGYGEDLGLDIESGYLIQVSTATGSFPAYGHTLTLEFLDYEFEVLVYFAGDSLMNRNVLGRHGFLNRLRLGLLDYEGKLLLSRQEDALSL